VNWNLDIQYLRGSLHTVSTVVKYLSCLRNTVYQDSSSLTRIFYKELSTFYYFIFYGMLTAHKIANIVLRSIIWY